jgi:flagellar biogenesis protein FliO
MDNSLDARGSHRAVELPCAGMTGLAYLVGVYFLILGFILFVAFVNQKLGRQTSGQRRSTEEIGERR